MKHGQALAVGSILVALVVAPFVLGDPQAIVDVLTARDVSPTIPPPPLVTIASPTDGDGVSQDVHLAGTARATWAQGLVRDVQYRVDGGAWHSIDVASRGLASVPFEVPLALTAGDHQLEARAADDHGYSTPARVAVRAGSPAPPTLRVLAPADGDGVAAGDVTVMGTVEGAGSYHVTVTVDGGAPQVAQVVSADGRGTLWRADVALPPGLRTLVARAEGDASSLPRSIVVSAAAPQAPPTLTIVRPERGAGFGTGGADECGTSTCIAFVGIASGGAPRSVRVTLDEEAPVTLSDVTVQGDAATWQWLLPVSGLYAGTHTARFVAEGASGASAPREATFLLRSTRTLDVTGDTTPAFTRTPLTFRVQGSATNASWTLDGARAGEGLQTTLQLATPGDHTLLASVADARGAGATVRVPLYARDRPPVITSVGAGTAASGTAIGLVATATDADGAVASFVWDYGDGTPPVATPTGVTTHAYARPGTYAASVLAVDELGVAGAAARTPVEVQNAPPTADFTFAPQQATRLVDVAFSDASGDADGAVVSWRWDFGDGGSSTQRSPVHRFLERGDLDVRLTVVDDLGAVARATHRVHVAAVPPVVDLDAEPANPDAGTPVNFTDRTVKLDGALVAWQWDFGDGSAAEVPNVTHAFAHPGRYVVTLVVTDDVGMRAARSRAIDVRDADPLVRSIRVEPDPPHAKDEVRFFANATDREGALDHVAWDFGDHASSSEFMPVHRYARAGTYDVNLTAFDAAGNHGSRTLRLRVLDAPPTVDLVPPDIAYAGFSSTIRAIADDADGSIARIVFDMDNDGVPECDGTNASCTWPYPSEGTFTARVDVTDDAGITTTARLLVDVLAPPVSLTPPNVTIDAPEKGARVRGAVVVAGAARGARTIRIVEAQLRNDTWTLSTPRGNAWTPATGTEEWGFVLDTRPYPDGAYEVVIRATDAGGGAALARLPIVIDNGPPPSELALRVVDLAPHQTIDGDVTVHGAAFHPQGLSNVRWLVDDGSWRPVVGPHQAFTIPLRARDLAAGDHTLFVEAYRGLLEHASVEIPFTAAPGTPVLFVDVAPAPVAYGVLHATGHAPNDSVVLWRLDHDVWAPVKGTASWTLDDKTTPDQAGPHTLSFKAVSLRTGLESQVVTFPVKVLDTTLASVLQQSTRTTIPRETPGAPMGFVIALATVAAALARRRC